jgi:pimeloyl-ACP methyl ester carboxylesterase
MWSAWALTCLIGGGIALYVAWALQLAAHGAPLWLLIAGAPLIYFGLILAFTSLYFAVAWMHRAQRPPQARIGIGATLRLVVNEYRALAGAAPRMIFYKLLLHDPVPAPADAPVLLLHGVLCNAGQWASFARVLAARNVHPVYTMSYGPPLASIDVFADQVAQKIDTILVETGAVDVIVVAHSMGGLVALAYCRKYGPERIRRLISLATPYHGSMHAWFFRGVCLTQLRCNSEWLAELYRMPFDMPPISSIWSWHDSMVAPQTSSRLDGAQNISLIGVGHNAILADPGAQSRVVALIRSEQALATTEASTSESLASVAQMPSARA